MGGWSRDCATPPGESDTLHGFMGAVEISGGANSDYFWAAVPPRMHRRDFGANEVFSPDNGNPFRPPIRWHKSESASSDVSSSDNSSGSGNTSESLPSDSYGFSHVKKSSSSKTKSAEDAEVPREDGGAKMGQKLCIGVVELPVAPPEAFSDQGTTESRNAKYCAEAIHYPHNPNDSVLERRISSGARNQNADSLTDAECADNDSSVDTIFPIFVTGSEDHVNLRNKQTRSPDNGGERWIVPNNANGLRLRDRSNGNDENSKRSIAIRLPRYLEEEYDAMPDPLDGTKNPERNEEFRDIPEEARLPAFSTNDQGDREEDLVLIHCLYWIEKDGDWEPVILLFTIAQFVQLPEKAFYKLFPTDKHRSWANEISTSPSHIHKEEWMTLQKRLANLGL